MLHFNTYYHIYNHANGDDNLFREKDNYRFFLKKYHHHIDTIAETFAWCLMPNHFHLLVKIKSEEEAVSAFPKFGTLEKLKEAKKAKSNFLSKRFANFFSSYTQAFNKVYGRRGSLFIKNFKRKEIPDQIYLRNIILYIHLNPIKHRFTTDIEEWEHSSYHIFPEDREKLMISLFEDHASYLSAHQKKKVSFNEYEILEQELMNT